MRCWMSCFSLNAASEFALGHARGKGASRAEDSRAYKLRWHLDGYMYKAIAGIFTVHIAMQPDQLTISDCISFSLPPERAHLL